MQVANDNADALYKTVEENREEYKDNLSGLIRDLSEIYVTCTLYHKAVEIIENILKSEDLLLDKDELFLLRTQLAHCYSLDGERIKAANLIVELRKRLMRQDSRLPLNFSLTIYKGRLKELWRLRNSIITEW